MINSYKIELEPIGVVKNSRTEVTDDFWGDIESEIILADKFSEDALIGIGDFSHVEVIFYFDKVDPAKIKVGANHPRNNTNWPSVGIFAQRGKNRTNQLGLTIVNLVAVKKCSLFVKGLDAINGTPVLDIKPVIKEFLPVDKIIQPGWAADLMVNYWKSKT